MRSFALVGAVTALTLACSGAASDQGRPEETGDSRSFVPEGLLNTELDGEGGLTLVASTLVDDGSGPKLYVAARNDGAVPACEAGMMVDFYDRSEALVTSSASTLKSGRFYDLGDGSGVIIRCIAPGQTAMTAFTDLPASIVIEELGRLSHRFPAFIIDGVAPVAGLTVGAVTTVGKDAGSVYTGTLTNELPVAVSAPSVSVFPVNRVGRPLAVATSSASGDVPSVGTWTFETGTVNEIGVGYAAFGDASIP